ncbi:hypothetical protein JVT61DRAFT_9372 [Boletus reticuloceps]|uniref:Uncharacterized protein n=1 Tax=Boletus reticuloceps TaxID=495285 RepID=A0A8I3A648_9AGAM|nr:hypothetical protein JVT61DRAFT_9372 [Boletus reticuloceps]
MATTVTLARTYQYFFYTHPNRTLALTCGTLNAFGDVVAQFTQNSLAQDHQHRPGWDPTRTLRFFCFGIGISPILGRWNLFLERKFPLRRRCTHRVSFKALSKRVAADQLIMAPLGLAIFVGSIGIMEGRTKNQMRDKYADMYTTALLTNWKIWPLAQLVNFRFMPLPYRIPFQSACGVFWTLYLSILNAKEGEKQDREAAMR